MSAHQLPALALLAAFTVTAAAAWAAAGRRRGAPAIAAALFVLQGALHLLFSLAGSLAGDTGHPAATPPHGMAGMAGTRTTHGTHAMHGMTGADGAPGMTGAHDMSDATAMFLDMSTGMLAAHLLAALLCGLWLAHGEAAFFTLARAALAYAFTPLRLLFARVPVIDVRRRPVRRARRSAHRPHTVVLAHTLSRRGPPRLSASRATTLGAHV
ncbi:hypothetical protein PV371_02195 [Streptomyces sp. TX20-6-3]|uniref:hypothetical protein n=1 Tax=Streptomyces sp. TX20-6-3 TaxID=3028705 RepID=UPI0029BA6D31|nr:hypothetical protein [Streptomyces sp. TX20-6-3]MDX2558464.1 hypothetical protein [Streptomyces sp. TX20-6-3]